MKNLRVFVAGAAGAIGWPLVNMLVSLNHEVIGITRKRERVDKLAKIGVIPEVVDVYDRGSLAKVLGKYQPEIVIHQLTDLPYGLPEEKMEEGLKKNNSIRLVGTRNLLDGLAGIPVKKLIVQSIAFMYGEGPLPHKESDSLGTDELKRFEGMIYESPPDTVILRYGRFYGKGTGIEETELACRVNVNAAAKATVLSLKNLNDKVYNVCEDSDYADNRKFILETHWDPLDSELIS